MHTHNVYGTFPVRPSIAGALILLASIFLNAVNSFGQLTTLYNFSTERADIRDSELSTDGTYLYGVRYDGSTNGHGSIFRTNLDGTGLLVLHRFADKINGVNPYGGVVLEGEMLYGMTNFGGVNNVGVIFKLKRDGTQFTKLLDFGPGTGALAYGRLIISGNTIFGTCAQGGGNIFKINTNGSGHTILVRFTGENGDYPTGPLVMSDSWLYGTTVRGGTTDSGVIYRVKIDGSDFQILHQFDGTNSAYPASGLVKSGAALYGYTSAGLISPCLFAIGEDGTGFNIIRSFSDTGAPAGKLIEKGNVLYGMLAGFGGSVYRIDLSDYSLTVVHVFSGSDGRNPSGSLIESGGKFYGYIAGGDYNYGVLFRLNNDGTSFQKLMQFTADNAGNNPNSSMVHAKSSVFGTTSEGGLYNKGVIYKMKNDGTDYKVLHHFNGSDGAMPEYSLTLAEDKLYSTTLLGGLNDVGTLFTIDTAGLNFEVLSHFGNLSGTNPLGGLTDDGEFLYGVIGGGPGYASSIYKFNRSTKVLSNVFYFNDTDIELPMGSLIVKGDRLIGIGLRQGGDNILYSVNRDGSDFQKILDAGSEGGGRNGGATGIFGDTIIVATRQGGGAIDMGTLYRVNIDGTGFKKLRDLNWQVGGNPKGEIIVSDTAIYGLLANGGPMDGGVVYSIAPDGTGIKYLINSPGPGATYGSISIDGNYLYAAMTQLPGQVRYGSIVRYELGNGTGPGPEIPEEEVPEEEVTGIETKAHGIIDIFPNPAGDVLNIATRQPMAGAVALFDSLGRKLTSVDLTSEVIDVSDLPPGIYTIVIDTAHARFIKR